MNFIKLIPVYLSSLVLCAHFVRSDNLIFAFFCLIIPFALLVPKKWVARLIQAYLVLGAIEWIIRLLLLIAERNAMGRDWTVSAIILGSVSVLTFSSAFVFRAKSLKERYNLGEKKSEEDGESGK